MKISSAQDCQLIQQDLCALYKYYKANNIKVNIKKCQCLSFSRKKEIINYPYNFNGSLIERTETVRDLGIWLDSKMLFSEHIDHITKKAYRNLGFLIRSCKPFRNTHSLKVVYFAYCRSILEYASAIWSPQYGVYINRIERIQKLFIKHLNYKTRRQSASYEEDCRHYSLMTLESRRELLDMSLLHDIVNSNVNNPNLLRHINFCTPRYRTRKTPLFSVPTHRTKYAGNCVLSRLVRTYNRKYNNVDLFNLSKLSLKRHIVRINRTK